ncbi:DUF116 domain-containing protein [Clostridium sp. P21]|uniref:DUF116 domain-containing protein n=1 Tax=Clostridium muellerianum TaxID=2716538 RepID=A0A7Y0EK31_9CLOT|nr:DUF116 domain-containing protein [Clostridium muellerianum]NMM64931.1 DUF116 domain-containing protein [Clostridium muellerianum]
MNVITYCLKIENDSSDLYYKEISLISDKVVEKIKSSHSLIINNFVSFIKRSGIEECRSNEEYILEFLTIGVLLLVYEDRAKKLKLIPQKALSYLSRVRNNTKILKPGFNKLKGILSTMFLDKNQIDSISFEKVYFSDFINLLRWMEASGDFKFSLERLVNWYKFLKSESKEYKNEVISKAISAAKWFKIEGSKSLSKYTWGVNNFLVKNHPGYRFREDVLFCGRKEIEYHLNMVGAEILNKVFRKDFIKTKSKMVLVPSCMRFHNDANCKVKKTDKGYFCASCSEACKVNKLSKIGGKHNFKVYMIPHESEAFSKGKILKREIGVVGVACVLNLLEGGWRAKSLNFIPQCVILDYCGCKNHWHKEEIKTDINMGELKRVLQI